MSKVTYAIDKVKLLEEYSNSTLSVLEFYVARDGNNAHGKPITKNAIFNAESTLDLKPVLANYVQWKQDFGGHEPEEVSVGVFSNKDGSFRIVEEDGEHWQVAKAYIWKQYAPQVIEVFEKKGGKTDVSMEIDVLEWGEDENGNETIEMFAYAGVTLLGVQPAIKGANATVLKYSVEDIEKEIDNLVYSRKVYDIPSGVKENVEMAIDLAKSLNRKTSSELLFMADALTNHDKIEFEHIEKINEYLKEHEGDGDARGNSNKYIHFNMYGGNVALEWSDGIINNISQKEFSDSDEDIHGKEKVMDNEKDIALEKEAKVDEESKVEFENPKEDEEKMGCDEEKMEDPANEEETEVEMQEEVDEEEMEEDEGDDDVYMQLEKAEYSAMTEKITNLENQNNDLQEKLNFANGQISELEQYKVASDKEKFEKEVDEILSGLEKYFSEDEIKSFKEKSQDYSLENISTYGDYIKARCFEASLKKDEDRKNKLDVFAEFNLKNNISEEDVKGGFDWAEAKEKYLGGK